MKSITPLAVAKALARKYKLHWTMNEPKPQHADATDPLVKAIRKARKGNPVDILAKLLQEESFWSRRQTIARNKLAKVRERINDFARDRAELTKHQPMLWI